MMKSAFRKCWQLAVLYQGLVLYGAAGDDEALRLRREAYASQCLLKHFEQLNAVDWEGMVVAQSQACITDRGYGKNTPCRRPGSANRPHVNPLQAVVERLQAQQRQQHTALGQKDTELKRRQDALKQKDAELGNLRAQIAASNAALQAERQRALLLQTERDNLRAQHATQAAASGAALQAEQRRNLELARALTEKDKFLDLLSMAVSGDMPSADSYSGFFSFCSSLAEGDERYEDLDVDDRLLLLLRYNRLVAPVIDEGGITPQSIPRGLRVMKCMNVVQLYNCREGGEWVFRRSVLNALNVAGDIDRASGKAPSVEYMKQALNSDVGIRDFWVDVQVPFHYTTGKLGIKEPGWHHEKKVVVATSVRGQILVAFYGSSPISQTLNTDWLTNLKIATKRIYSDDLFGRGRFVRGHAGFIDALSCKDELLSFIRSKIALLQGRGISDPQIIFAGHSLGGSVATVASLYACIGKLLPKGNNHVILMTLGQPRVWQTRGWFGSVDGRKVVECLEGNWLRVVASGTIEDPVTRWPPRSTAFVIPAEVGKATHLPYYEDYGWHRNVASAAGPCPHEMNRFYKDGMLRDDAILVQ